MVIQDLESSLVEGEEAAERIESSEVFDKLIEEVNDTGTNVTGALKNTNPRAKEDFLSNPNLQSPPNELGNLKLGEVKRKLTKIRNLEQAVQNEGSLSAMEKRILNMALKRNRGANAFLLANIRYNEAPTLINAAVHRAASEAFYGRPQRGIFGALFDVKLKIAKKRAFENSEDEAYDELLRMLGEVKPSDTKLYRPKAATVRKFSELAVDFFEPILTEIPKGQKMFTPAEAAEIANRALKKLAPQDTAWHAVCVPDEAIASVGNFTLKFPGKRSLGDYNREELRRILVHELGTHVVRALPFEHCKIAMFRGGLPDYEAFEEGLACVAEQAIAKNPVAANDVAHAEHYICLGLIYFQHTNFRETFEILKRLNNLTGTWNESKTFDLVQRAFRGTDKLPNNRDLVYYTGYNLVWQFIEENIHDPDLMKHLFISGKTNYADTTHERIAKAIREGKI